jgi:hypothetical protein
MHACMVPPRVSSTTERRALWSHLYEMAASAPGPSIEQPCRWRLVPTLLLGPDLNLVAELGAAPDP